MSELYDVLGIDVDDVEWRDLAICKSLPHTAFYEDYEADPEHAKNIDDLCASCPVRKQCLFEGAENKEYGVWGGWYLTAGQVDEARNLHKTEEVEKRLRKF